MKPIRNDPSGTFARTARDMAERLRREGVAAPAVGVVVNRVDLARAIFERLSETEDAPFDCLLLIGRSRDVSSIPSAPATTRNVRQPRRSWWSLPSASKWGSTLTWMAW